MNGFFKILLRYSHGSRVILFGFILSLLLYSSVSAGFKEVQNCLQKNNAALSEARLNPDKTALLKILDTCIPNTPENRNNQRLYSFFEEIFNARAAGMYALLSPEREKEKKALLTSLAEDAKILIKGKPSNATRAAAQGAALLSLFPGQFKYAGHLLVLGGLDFPGAYSDSVKIPLLHLAAAQPEFKARQETLLKEAQELENKVKEEKPQEYRGIVLTLAQLYKDIGDPGAAGLHRESYTPAQDLPPCLTPEMLQESAADKDYWAAMAPFYSKIAQVIKETDSSAEAMLAVIDQKSLDTDIARWGEKSFLLTLKNGLEIMLALNKGNLGGAIERQQEEIDRRTKEYGEDSPCAQEARLWLANVYMGLTEFDKALSIINKVLETTQNTSILMEMHRNKSLLSQKMGDLETAKAEAQSMLHVALENQARNRKIKSAAERLADDRHVASAYALLSYIYMDRGEYEEGKKAYAEALSHRETKETWDSIVSTLNVKMLTSEGKYKEALEQVDKLLAYEKSSKGMQTGLSLPDKAVIFSRMGDYARSFALRRESLDDETGQIIHKLSILPDSAAGYFIAASRALLLETLDEGARFLNTDKMHLQELFGLWIQRKGLLLESQRRYQAYQIFKMTPEAKDIQNKLDEIKKAILVQEMNLKGETNPEQLESLRKEQHALEEKLKKIVPALLTAESLQQSTPAALARVLPENSVLVDFARVLDTKAFNTSPYSNFKDLQRANALDTEAQIYLAFILHPGDGSLLSVIRLGGAKDIDAAISSFRQAVASREEIKEEEKISELRNTGIALRKLLFDPLKAHLGNVSTIYISPDGQINLLPFETLPEDGEERWLIDSYSFKYLAASRDLLAPLSKAEPGASLVMGDPDFSCTPGKEKIPLPELEVPAKDRAVLVNRMRRLLFSPLPATLEEVKTAKQFLGVETELLTGCEATKSGLFEYQSPPKIMHLATHGFFLPDRTGAPNSPALSMRRSGLAFAGANLPEYRESSLLMAEEVLGLNLRGTDLVVLSACQTGLGEVQSGEGVYGLRRAFSQAGAKAQIMSLWSVPDKETEEIMSAFYSDIYAGQKPAQALHKAMLAQKKITKERYGFAHPFFWGAFVYLGQE